MYRSNGGNASVHLVQGGGPRSWVLEALKGYHHDVTVQLGARELQPLHNLRVVDGALDAVQEPSLLGNNAPAQTRRAPQCAGAPTTRCAHDAGLEVTHLFLNIGVEELGSWRVALWLKEFAIELFLQVVSERRVQALHWVAHHDDVLDRAVHANLVTHKKYIEL